MEDALDLCDVCEQPSQHVCGDCESTYYCSHACQQHDWQNGHDEMCIHWDDMSEDEVHEELSIAQQLAVEDQALDVADHIDTLMQMDDRAQSVAWLRQHYDMNALIEKMRMPRFSKNTYKRKARRQRRRRRRAKRKRMGKEGKGERMRRRARRRFRRARRRRRREERRDDGDDGGGGMGRKTKVALGAAGGAAGGMVLGGPGGAVLGAAGGGALAARK